MLKQQVRNKALNVTRRVIRRDERTEPTAVTPRWIVDPARPAPGRAPRRVLLACVVVALMLGMVIGGQLQQRAAPAADPQVVVVPSPPPTPDPLQPATPSSSMSPQQTADDVARSFLTAWLQGPAFEPSKRGHAAWLATVSPYVDGGTYGVLQLADHTRVPAAANGAPLRVARIVGTGQVGDVATLTATLSNGRTVSVTVVPQGTGWRVAGYRAG